MRLAQHQQKSPEKKKTTAPLKHPPNGCRPNKKCKPNKEGICTEPRLNPWLESEWHPCSMTKSDGLATKSLRTAFLIENLWWLPLPA